MNFKRIILNIFIVSFILLLFSFCSTKKAGFTNRAYHNLTAHYNVWWNGNEAFKDGLKDLETKAQDNYTDILPVFKYGTLEEAMSQNPQWDRGIEKGQKTIAKHSIYIRGKEYCKWADDAYLLIGKSQLYKQDYASAKRTFNYIISQYKTDPSRYEAMLWLARLQSQQKEFTSAGSLIGQVQSGDYKNELNKSTKKQINLVQADYYIRQRNYKPAVDFLKLAIHDTKNKQMNTRLRFILAQIYQQDNQLAEASKYYRSVVKRNPSYEMAFNAKINMAITYDEKNGNASDVQKILLKMLKDRKNGEYHDQIYYALAEFSNRLKKQDDAIKYYELSVSSSTNNNYQKTASSLKLADIYFDKQSYVKAQQYYDTAVLFLPADYPNYKMVKHKNEILSSLVRSIQTVIVEDSLQAMQNMTESARNAKINKTIQDYVAFEKQQKIEKQLEEQRIAARAGSNTAYGNNNASGDWYFYNPSMMNFGYNDFLKKWGSRKLEDRWRLSNKELVIIEEITTTNPEDEDVEKDSSAVVQKLEGEDDPKNRNYYLKNLPNTPEKLEASNQRIADALKNMGYVYYEELKNPTKSTASFLDIPQRFSDHPYSAEVYYQVYRIYSEQQDIQNKEKYKDIILKNYPESVYANVIKDPDYYKVLAANLDKENRLYQETYVALSKKDYPFVRNNVAEHIKSIKNADLVPKFLYLDAIAAGKLQGKDALITALNAIKNNYSDSDIIPLVDNLLEYTKNNKDLDIAVNTTTENNITDTLKNNNSNGQTSIENKTTTNNSSKTDSAKTTATEQPKPIENNNSIFSINEKSSHYYVSLVNSKNVNINVIKLKIGDFNRMYFAEHYLGIEHLFYNDNNQLLLVSKFKDKEAAKIYFNLINKENYVYKNIETSDYSHFIISEENFKLFFDNKKLSEYLEFFKNNY